jgi:hypothetical protein
MAKELKGTDSESTEKDQLHYLQKQYVLFEC